MILKINSLYILAAGLILSSCFKEEIPIPKHEPGENQDQEVAMGEDYRHQLYFDLSSNEVVKSNLKTAWDLAFESSGEGAHVILNTAKSMGIHRSTLSFDELTSVPDEDWHWDTHTGNLDSTAIGDWQNDDFLYVVDRGYDWAGEHQGYMKLEIITMDASSYQIGYGDIGASSPTEFSIIKNPATQFTYFSFEEEQVVIAPEDVEYDLVFTQYTHLFHDPLMPYVVTGVLLNRGYTRVARADDLSFDDIDLSTAESLTYSSNLNAIGYNWKGYDLEGGGYTTYSDQHYVINTQDGAYYVLRFTGFYSIDGIKGYPNFEFREL